MLLQKMWVADVSMVNNDAVEDVLVKGLHVHAGDLDGILWEDADVSSVLLLTIDNVGKRDNRITATEVIVNEARKEDGRVERVVAQDVTATYNGAKTTRSPPQSTI